MDSVIDLPALITGILVAAVISSALLWANRGNDHRRAWIVSGMLIAGLTAAGAADVLREPMREMKVSTPLVASSIATLLALGMVRGTRKVSAWLRGLLVFVTALVALFGGLLFGATYVSRFLPF